MKMTNHVDTVFIKYMILIINVKGAMRKSKCECCTQAVRPVFGSQVMGLSKIC